MTMTVYIYDYDYDYQYFNDPSEEYDYDYDYDWSRLWLWKMGRYQQKNEAISAPKNGAISARVDKSAHRRKVSSSLSCLISLLAFQKSWKSFKFETLEVGKVDYDYVVLLLCA